jgi:arsenate reductase
MNPKLKILFLCTGNSCRSQMAEGFAKALHPDTIEAHSAGIDPHGMNLLAIQVMRETGVDITSHHSKHADSLNNIPFDYVITVCGHANETCPAWLGKNSTVVHVGFDDPPALAKSAKTPEEALTHYRRVRDEIKAYIQTLPNSLPQNKGKQNARHH